MKKRVLSCLLILALLFSTAGINTAADVSTTYAASKSAQSYKIKKGKIYKKNGGLVKKKVVTIKKKKYYAKKNGKIAKNKLVTYKGNKYYAGKKGVIKTKSFFKVKKKLYYADKAGKIYKNKLITVKKKLYYSQKDYSIATNKKVTVNGKVYQADKNGVLTEIKDEKSTEPTAAPTSSGEPSPSAAPSVSPDSNATPEVTPAPSAEPTASQSSVPTSTPGSTSENGTIEKPSEDSTDALVEKENAPGYITPQEYGAVANDGKDDSDAFRKMILDAYLKSYNASDDGYKHCMAIYIPEGVYDIEKTLIDEKPFYNSATGKNVYIRYGMFDISGAGSDKTTIRFSSDILFDDSISEANKGGQNDKPPFGFTTFRDIKFEGNNKNTFMTIDDNKSRLDGAQRLQFISCEYTACNKILYAYDSDIMLSEITFSYCNIHDCGNKDNPCQLFITNNPQAVDWRFIDTDIVSFIGEAFHYEKGTGVRLFGGSVIPTSGIVFNFAIPDKNKQHTGPGNSPQISCNGTKFVINESSTLLRKRENSLDNVIARFKACELGTDESVSDSFLDINGAINIMFEECSGCDDVRIAGDVGVTDVYPNGKFIKPVINFKNCSDLDVDNLVKNSIITNSDGDSFILNSCHVTVDSTYDFYIKDSKYIQTVRGLSECRQPMKISQGQAEAVKPYGFVKSVDIKVPDDNTFNNDHTFTITLFDKGKLDKNGNPTQIGTMLIQPKPNESYSVPVKDYVDELQVVFTKTSDKIVLDKMSMNIVKY